MSPMLGQPGLSVVNAAYRPKFASASGWRRMNHSTSFRAAGSPIVFCIAVASLVLALRARSMAFFTAARSPESRKVSALGGGTSLDPIDLGFVDLAFADLAFVDLGFVAASCFACPACLTAASR